MSRAGRPRGRAVSVGVAIAVAVAVAVLTLTGCMNGSNISAGPPIYGRPIQVVTTFYPLEYLVQRVGGDAVDVTDLAAPGVEPHDLELSPKDVAAVVDADLVVYLSGFQAAVDTAVQTEAPATGWDVASAASLSLTYEPTSEYAVKPQQPITDPHFWLDPTRYAAVAKALAVELERIDASRAATFSTNANALVKELDQLDQEWKRATVSCDSRDLVTSHAAFGYLAARYGFTQIGVSGLSPESEPSAKALATTADFVREHDISTIYYETLVDPAIAQTVANETGAVTAALDPIEGLSSESAGTDYFSIMRADLATLLTGQGCR